MEARFSLDALSTKNCSLFTKTLGVHYTMDQSSYLETLLLPAPLGKSMKRRILPSPPNDCSTPIRKSTSLHMRMRNQRRHYAFQHYCPEQSLSPVEFPVQRVSVGTWVVSSSTRLQLTMKTYFRKRQIIIEMNQSKKSQRIILPIYPITYFRVTYSELFNYILYQIHIHSLLLSILAILIKLIMQKHSHIDTVLIIILL